MKWNKIERVKTRILHNYLPSNFAQENIISLDGFIKHNCKMSTYFFIGFRITHMQDFILFVRNQIFADESSYLGVLYSSNKIKKTQIEHLIIVRQTFDMSVVVYLKPISIFFSVQST